MNNKSTLMMANIALTRRNETLEELKLFKRAVSTIPFVCDSGLNKLSASLYLSPFLLLIYSPYPSHLSSRSPMYYIRSRSSFYNVHQRTDDVRFRWAHGVPRREVQHHQRTSFQITEKVIKKDKGEEEEGRRKGGGREEEGRGAEEEGRRDVLERIGRGQGEDGRVWNLRYSLDEI